MTTVTFLPGVYGRDAIAQYWLGQVTLRLRREISWLWRERAIHGSSADALPPAVDQALAALDLARFDQEKRAFFAGDLTARHLSHHISASVPDQTGSGDVHGSFGWVVQELSLEPVECFVLAMALLPGVDSAAGPVIASCLNDVSRTAPTLALAHRLWDEPDEVLRCFDPAHALLRHGLISVPGGAGLRDWQTPLAVPTLVARELLFPGDPLPAALDLVEPAALPLEFDPAALARVSGPSRLSIIPVIGAEGSPLAGVAAACSSCAGMPTVQPGVATPREQLGAVLTVAWLRGQTVYWPVSRLAGTTGHDGAAEALPLPGLPVTVFVGAAETSALRGLGPTLPALVVASLTYAERLDHWQRAVPSSEAVAPELARRFRYEADHITRVGRELAALGRPPRTAEILTAARADLDLGSLAQHVKPRFRLDELMLPAPQTRQIHEIVAAMNNLTRVHYEWGTAQAWNESGLTALFAGASGTGKTMAAEVIAAELTLPLYRIDLSQVVDKYIGETEKNLRKLFDAADSADVILFFDEADALFGKRTEVKDAHDRYANLEVSYLLDRMERFKGLAILATNRKKDLDEAFLRRLRFVVEFSMPGPDERLRIWRSVVPAGVDATEVDVEFLAQRFTLTGGHIRSIVFHACLQNAAPGAPRRLTMEAVVRAVQREFDKLERVSSLEQFGPYAHLVAGDRSTR
jgi:hypothetical protein